MKRTLLLVLVSSVLSLLIGVYIAHVTSLSEAGLIRDSDRLQISLSLADLVVVATLAAITLWYAQSTKEIADATRTQADATRAQVDVVARQLTQGVRPIIRFAFDSLPALNRFNLVIRNIGVGPALNVKCWVQIQQTSGSQTLLNNDGHQREFRTSVLEVNAVVGDGSTVNWQINVVPAPAESCPCTFFAIYQDVYENNFVSKAVYKPRDFQNTRPLIVSEFSVKELTKAEAENLLGTGGYSNTPR